MARRDIAIKGHWPSNIFAWFKNEFARNDLSTAARDRLCRLAFAQELQDVAERLKRIESVPHRFGYDRSVELLRRAWMAPDLWFALKQKPPRDRNQELKEFHHKCVAFIRTLEAERDFAIYYFVRETLPGGLEEEDVHDYSDRGKVRPQFLAPATERFDALIKTLRGLMLSAKHGNDAWPGPIKYTLPAKKKSRKRPDSPEEVFCMMQLFEKTSFFFGKPLCPEVAQILSVVLKRPISPARAKSTWNEFRKTNIGVRINLAFPRATIEPDDNDC